MKFVENVNEKTFNDFIKNKNGSFMQTSYFGKINKYKGLNYFLVGLEDNDKLVASAMILEKHLIGKYNYLYIPRGFITDYKDNKLMDTFTKYLKDFGKNKKAVFIAIDPEIIISIDDDKKDNLELEFKKLGYKHLGYNYYFENRQPRFTYRLTLTEDLFDNFHSTTKKIYKRGNIYNLDIYKGSLKDIDDFHKLMVETGDRQSAKFFSKDYYYNFYETFNKENMSDIYVAKAKVGSLKKLYEEELDKIKNDLLKIKNEGKRKDLNDKLAKYQKEYEEILEVKTEEIVLSSIITVKFNDTVWTVHGGNSTKLRFLNSNYWVYFKIIEDALKEGYKYADFFGTIGKEDKNSHEYGIRLFKKRLGGNLLEFIGEFDLVLNKLVYFAYKKVYIKLKYRK